MKKRQRKWGVGVILLLGIGFVGTSLFTSKLPIEHIDTARHFLSQAEKINAEVYSNSLYLEAKILYDSAMGVWKRENERLFFLRHYQNVDSLVRQAGERAQQAIAHTEEKRTGKAI